MLLANLSRIFKW